MTEIFRLILIKPSGYDDDGYVIQWRRAVHPLNALTVLNTLAQDCAGRRVLGPDTDIVIEAYEDQTGLPPVKEMIRRIKDTSAGGMVGFVGVHTSQFPRTADLARQFRRAGIQVMIGGFHVSGSMIMLQETPPELQEMLDLEVSLFVGEAEGRLDQVLQDAHGGRLQPVYNFAGDLVDLETAVVATHLPETVEGSLVKSLSPPWPVEAGRGCPFKCSFCTIINVHGRKARTRSPKSVADQIRSGVSQGRSNFFFTDDNFVRNPRWREILEALIRLRETEGLSFFIMLQVDARSDNEPDFIHMAVRAGCSQIFVGMESINPKALAAVGKTHNSVERYQRFFLAWKRHGVRIMVGYILGFPTDTPAGIRQDLETIKRELAIDYVYFYVLTPLPGSADHRNLLEQGVALEPDLNRFTSLKATIPHPHMSSEELNDIYLEAWQTFYDDAHCRRIMERHAALGGDLAWHLPFLIVARGSYPIDGVHPFEAGLLRVKNRREKRPGTGVEPLVPFMIRRCKETLASQIKWVGLWVRLSRMAKGIQRSNCGPDPKDPALKGIDIC